jgi:hypothetical protein
VHYKLLPVGAARGALGLSALIGAAVLVGATGLVRAVGLAGAALGADGGTAGLCTGDMGAAMGVITCGAATGTDTGPDEVARGDATGLVGEATGLIGEAAIGEDAVGLVGAESTIEKVMVMAFPDRPVPRLEA